MPRNIAMLLVALSLAGLSGCATVGIPSFGASGPSDLEGEALAAESPADARETAAPHKQASKPSDPAVLPKNPESQFAFARLCERRGENEQAERIYLAMQKRNPNDARILHRLGVIAAGNANFAKAQRYFRDARAQQETVELLADMGYCYYLDGKLPEAEQCLNRALKREPNHRTSLNDMGLVLGAQGRYDKALSYFKRANSEAEAYANLAYVTAQNGELAKAQETYLKALTLDSNLRAAAQAMMQVAERRERQNQVIASDARSRKASREAGRDHTPESAPQEALAERARTDAVQVSFDEPARESAAASKGAWTASAGAGEPVGKRGW